MEFFFFVSKPNCVESSCGTFVGRFILEGKNATTQYTRPGSRLNGILLWVHKSIRCNYIYKNGYFS